MYTMKMFDWDYRDFTIWNLVDYPAKAIGIYTQSICFTQSYQLLLIQYTLQRLSKQDLLRKCCDCYIVHIFSVKMISNLLTSTIKVKIFKHYTIYKDLTKKVNQTFHVQLLVY